MSKVELLRELYSCDLCFGFWIYLGLSLFTKNINVENINNKYVGKFVVASFATFIMHLISTGWDELFGTVYIDDAYRKFTSEG